jgi:DUF4097 and DUF4098 domain-containing protein YvlB
MKAMMPMRLPTRSVLLALLLALLPAGASAQRKIDRRLALDPTGMVRVWNLAGSVRVIGWDRDSIVVTGTIPNDILFNMGGSRSGVKLGLDVPMREDGKIPPAHLEVRVPQRAQVWLKAGSGDIVVENLSGSVDAYTVGGNIRISGSPREVLAESMGGQIDLSVTTRSLRAKNASGGIRLSGRVEEVVATTVSGRLAISGIELLSARFESIEGDILFQGALPRGAQLDFVSHSGTVELTLPAKTSADFSISTFQGQVTSDFGSAKLGAARDLKGKELNFTLGNYDGTRVSIRNFKGNIVLRRK